MSWKFYIGVGLVLLGILTFRYLDGFFKYVGVLMTIGGGFLVARGDGDE